MLYGIKKDCPIKTAFFIYLIITIPNIPFTNMKYGMFGFEIFWRRTRDSNPRAGFPTYSLSRGAPSPLGYFSKDGIISISKRSCDPAELSDGGEEEIRTLGPLRDH